jgi:ABC-2 type transport system ATP-binding protein
MHPIQIESVVKTFGGRRALDAISLELRAGEVLGLLGPNGAGKSTLVRTIMGRVAPDSGVVRLFGVEARPGDPAPRSMIGVVPQEIAVYPLLSPYDNLTVFGRYYGLSGKELHDSIERALTWSGLADRMKEATGTFSGGMKRRLNMAAGVLHKPRVLLLDEPTVGIDPQSRERVYAMIAELRADGVSILYTTHYMEEAERLCDRIAVADSGRVIATGTKDELVASTIGSQREVSIETVVPLDETMRAELEARGARIEGTHASFSSERAADELVAILHVMERGSVAVRDVSIKSPTLEKVFLHLTGKELRE